MERPRWADLVDSSQEAAPEEEPRHDAARSLLKEDSYCGDPDPELENSKKGLSSQFAAAAALNSGPKDFAFLIHDQPDVNTSIQAKSRQDCEGVPGQNGQQGRKKLKQKRRQAVPGVVEAPSGKRVKAAEPSSSQGQSSSTASQAMELAATEEDWQHREQKRRKALLIVKSTPEYQVFSQADKTDDAPRTPDASDKSMSKRRWEQEVQQWRASLRRWCERSAPSTS